MSALSRLHAGLSPIELQQVRTVIRMACDLIKDRPLPEAEEIARLSAIEAACALLTERQKDAMDRMLEPAIAALRRDMAHKRDVMAEQIPRTRIVVVPEGKP